MPVLVEIQPDGEVLPIRAQYEEGGDYQIGLNFAAIAGDQAVWYMLPDLVASKLLTGKVPRIRRALRLRPLGVQSGLRPARLLGEVLVDPQQHDFFRVLIEKRHEFQQARDAAGAVDDTVHAKYLDGVQQGLKIIANATSYGIFAEIDEKRTGAKQAEVYGLWHFRASITQEEHPGPFSFAPLAALATSAARLMLAMAETELKARGATFAFADTDSMAIVGPTEVVRAVRLRFAHLTPYAFGGDLLKIEEENQPVSRAAADPSLYCLAISAKRYVLFNIADDGSIIIRKQSEHGLGHLLSPVPGEGSKGWMDELWAAIVKWARRDAPQPAAALPFANLPALGKFPIMRPIVLERLGKIRTRRGRGATMEVRLQHTLVVRPFNFLLAAYPDTGDITSGGEAYWKDPEPRGRWRPSRLKQPIRPIAPYEQDPRKWRGLKWVDLHTGRSVRLSWTAEPTYLETGAIRVQIFRDVLRRHLAHPESKAAGPDGEPCISNTVGELQRLSVSIVDVLHIGKESHELEEVQQQLVAPAATYVIYVDEAAEWEKDLQTLFAIPRRKLSELSGLHPRSLRAVLNRARSPHPKHRALLHAIAAAWRAGAFGE